MKSLLQSFII